MTCELVTGSAGTDHVSSADDGSMFASVFGTGRYAVHQGNDLAATLNNANSVTLATGAGFIDGRYWRITAAETLTIDSGAQGMNRIDLVGVKYELTGGVESASVVVVKGTATSGTPSMPTYTDGNIINGATEAFFPLYSIEITGIVPADPVQLFSFLGGTVSCPWPVGAVLQMVNGTNPNTIYPGTTWSKIEGRFLLGSSSSYTLGNTGGASTFTLTESNMPSHSHTYSKANSTSGSTAITVSQLPSNYASFAIYPGAGPNTGQGNSNVSLSDYTASSSHGFISTSGSTTTMKKVTLTGSGSGHTHSVSTSSASTGSKGSGTSVNKMPPYKVVNIWERTA